VQRAYAVSDFTIGISVAKKKLTTGHKVNFQVFILGSEVVLCYSG
jgi:hypothetical protein